MSPDPTAAVETPSAWPALSLHERRVLGVLVEKAKTTPDTYPLSVNALVAGCNQKSNRDPVLDLSEAEVEDALAGVQQKGLAIKITGGRVVRWRHNLYETWKVDKLELAILAELLLRGPQTEGELRGRASRMEPVAELDALRAVLRPMAERGLVVYLTPEGRRGTVLSHGFHAVEELERLRAGHGTDAEAAESTPLPAAARTVPVSRPQAVPAPAESDRLAEAVEEINTLKATVTSLQATVVDLAEEVRRIKDRLPEPPVSVPGS
jgi:uncharacterized protein YceH (UPF0502 family)